MSKPQATLMAMAAHNPAFAKKKGIPQNVARDFNRADKRAGILKKGGGGPASMMGHALSGTQLGAADNLIRKAQDRFTMFADGGAVKTPAKPQPSAKERSQIRALIEQGKQDAVSSLRDARSFLLGAKSIAPMDSENALAKLTTRLRTKPKKQDAALTEYQELLESIQAPDVQPDSQMEMLNRASQLAADLEARGISIPQ